MSGSKGLGQTSVNGRIREPKPAAINMALEIVVMKQDLS